MDKVAQNVDDNNLIYTIHEFPRQDDFAEKLYNVKLDAMDKEAPFIRDFFRVMAEGKEGTVSDCRVEDAYWDRRTICIAFGAEEYLASVYHGVDENYRHEYEASIITCMDKNKRDEFVKNLEENCAIDGIRVTTISEPEVSREYLQKRFEVDREILFAGKSREDMPLKSLGLSEWKAVDVGFKPLNDERKNKAVDELWSRHFDTVEKEKVRKDKNVMKVFVRPEAFARIKDKDGKTKGISISGYRAPDGEYYKAELLFKETDGVSVDIIQKGKFKGWAVAKLKPGAAVGMVAKDEIMITVDGKEFGKFIEQKNHKFVRQKEAEKTAQQVASRTGRVD